MTRTMTITAADLHQVKSRQRLVTEAMRAHHVRHPADLPIPVILWLRAARLGRRY